MVLLILGLVALIGVAAILLRRPKKKHLQNNRRNRRKQPWKSTGKGSVQQAPSGPYAAVSIKPCPNSCAAAFETSNLRYLKSSAPSLPIEGCNSRDCQCSFTHHLDRRGNSDEDRRIGIGLQTELYGTSGETNRRKNQRGRRLGDRH
ncbi:hypothetical protein [Congregibacter sp.]|uniref:hypothetical protein n=1 Tax=Congregibacter sp. TaxID=2744308 RepID=UPI00385EEAEC